ncbi:ethyl tert-butyl ether degradation protein EthD [Rhodococcus sp. WMMA185]|uniref:EthD family reductase n=1 Tax=Rhodococcus sp. WMMA185 TaxID=679318 RepID=UPI00087833A0|nr:EthD family reductase [Rhodococcus sp. WMMA185]AOW94085.1 ethyl tert-butyl ether degradation protein EthD [Rhodococcus sp. WMMA185]
MSVKIVVCYGRPEDPDKFDTHYRDVHIPLARKTPGLSDYTWGKCSTLDGSEPPYYAIAALHFPDSATMQSALSSDEMRQARQDVPNFASGGVTMYVQDEESVYNQ